MGPRARKRGGAGGDNQPIAAFHSGAASRLAKIRDDIVAGRYTHLPYRTVSIPKKDQTERILRIPSIADRIVHTAIAQTIGPTLDAQFEPSSFGYRPGRSVGEAVQKIEAYRDAGYWYVVEADIEDFFDTVDHGRLLAKLALALPKEPQIVDLIAEILSHQAVQAGGAAAKGLAQGSPLSPLLANLYLDALDERLERGGVRLVRFADDFILLCKKQAKARDAIEVAAQTLASEGLTLNREKSRVSDFSKGFGFLGHLFVRSFAIPQPGETSDNTKSLLQAVAGQDEDAAEAEKTAAKENDAGYDQGERVLYVLEPGRKVDIRNLSFCVLNQTGQEMAAISHSRVDRIEIGDGVDVAPSVLTHALHTQTDLAFISGDGTPLAQLTLPNTSAALLQQKQASAANNYTSALPYVRAIADARIRNQRTQLFRLNRTLKSDEVTQALAAMGRHLRKLPHLDTIEGIRGIEGVCAAEYWPALGITCQNAPTPLRRSRPARDPLNAAINYLTAILARDMRAAIISSGLHPGFGMLHATTDRTDAAVYDLMEPFRAPLTEGIAVTLFNQNRLRPGMFNKSSRRLQMSMDARRALIKAYEAATARRVNVRGRKHKLAWRPMMRRQALDLCAALRKDDPALFLPYLMEA